MIAGTHITFASVLYLGGAALFEYDTDLVGWALAAAASLLPDTDLPTSKLGRALFWVSTRLERRFGHRTITHSFVALAGVALLASPLLIIHPVWFWCVVGGYWSHPWIDMLNIRGADLLWPSPIRVVMPGNRNWRIEVGSKAEMVLLTCLVVACLMARDSFIEQAGTQWFTVQLEATDNLTLEHITCDCPVLGTWQSGLIVLHDGRPRAVGKSQVHHNLYPTSTKLIEGEPLRVVSHKVDIRGRTLRWLIERLDKRHTYYLSGEMMVGSKLDRVEDLDLYRPADFDGKVLQLHYARAAELGPYLGMVAAQGEVYVQFWLKAGETAVEVSLSDERPEEAIPEVLRQHL